MSIQQEKWYCIDCKMLEMSSKEAAFDHSAAQMHDLIDETLLPKFKEDCGNVPFLHCEDGCDCGDCGMCG
jgi:hypothetical protein